jgi:hypothetical protein
MRRTHLLAHALLALLLTHCERAALTRAPPDPLFLNAASQDRALFLTWNAAANSRRVRLRCRRVGGVTWQDAEGDSGGYHLFDGLENGITYECYAERELTTGETILSRPVIQTPRTRRFQLAHGYFASQPAADSWLKRRGIDPRSLHLRGEPVKTWSPAAPDGMYTNGNGEVVAILLRYADETFRPPVALRAPGDVRTVLKHALWHTVNPFDHAERFPMRITPIEPAIVGRVSRFASATSFAIAYHPQLSSRYTRFIPANPSPGRVAIYIEGHAGPTVRFGATTIDRLLERGWQVIAMDMPLIGVNAEDRSETFSQHDAFARWPSDEFSPVALFLQPLKAIVDQIYREDSSSSQRAVMLIGKSGGGWTTYMYGALDERIHYVVGIAGGMPMSQWAREQPTRPADYEQIDPLIFESVLYEDIMPIAGSRGAFYVYNENDPCCFRLHPDEPFVRYLKDASVELNKPIGVYVDRETTTHSFSTDAFAELHRFVETTEAAIGNPHADPNRAK